MTPVARPLLFAGTALFAAATAEAQEASVSIQTFKFTPAELTVPLGATVRWTNTDDTPHTVIATDKSFRSPPLHTGDHFFFTFTKTGDFAYFCTLHPQMTGTIKVTPPRRDGNSTHRAQSLDGLRMRALAWMAFNVYQGDSEDFTPKRSEPRNSPAID